MKKLFILCCFSLLCLLGCKSDKTTNIEVITLAKTTESWNNAQLPKYPDGDPEITIFKNNDSSKNKIAMA